MKFKYRSLYLGALKVCLLSMLSTGVVCFSHQSHAARGEDLRSCSYYEKKRSFGSNSTELPVYAKGLSPLWFEEYIGTDLANTFLDNRRKFIHETRVGVIDGAINISFLPKDSLAQDLVIEQSGWYPNDVGHGTVVSNIIADNQLEASNKLLQSLYSCDDLFGSLTDDCLVNRLESAMRSKAKVFNLSLYVPSQQDDKIRKLFERLLGKDIIFVIASGNYFHKKSRENVFEKPLSEQIIVGSLSPWGTVSGFSNESDFMSVLAPSDFFLLGRGQKFIQFGGTSGAAPIVTRAVADLLSILPDLTLTQVKQLLAKTALKTSNTFGITQKNGRGTLNHFKLLMVAEKLRTKRAHSSGVDFLDTLINDKETYKFDDERSALEKMKDLLTNAKSCKERSSALQELRKIFLLTEDLEAAQVLADFYSNLGLTINAAFYRSFLPEGIEGVLVDMLNTSGFGKSASGQDIDSLIRGSVYRTLEIIAPRGKKALEIMLDQAKTKPVALPADTKSTRESQSEVIDRELSYKFSH